MEILKKRWQSEQEDVSILGFAVICCTGELTLRNNLRFVWQVKEPAIAKFHNTEDRSVQ